MSGRAPTVRSGALGWLLLAALACAPDAATRAPVDPARVQPIVVADGRYVMGTVLEVELQTAELPRAEAQRALEGAFAEASALDSLLSRFQPTSDVSRLNARAGEGAIEVDPRVREALAEAQRAAVLTEGAFDVTAGPVIAAWILAAERNRPPSEDERQHAVAHVGAERIRIGADGRVGLEAGTSIDLGGFAKGFALDRMATDLRRVGIGSGFLSFGQSSVRALGSPSDARAWRLLLRAPGGGFVGTVELRDRALSVSSSLEPSSEIGGVRYGHVVDPRTGRALTEVRQAAVVSPSATLAEILSTALLVLDEDRGRVVAARLGAEAFVVDARGRGWQTAAWAQEAGFAELPDPRPGGPDSAR